MNKLPPILAFDRFSRIYVEPLGTFVALALATASMVLIAAIVVGLVE